MTSSTETSSHPTQLNVVQLSSENIELRMRIDKAEDVIDALRLKLSQSLANKATGASGSPPGVVGGSVSADEYDALEAELDEARQREEHLKATIQQLQNERSESTPPRRRALTIATTSPTTALTPPGAVDELAAARRRIETLESSEKKLKAAIDDLNDALENATTSSPAPSTTDHAQVQQELNDAKQAIAAHRAEYERRLQEAHSERNIALRVKTEALKEAASARTEVERLRSHTPKQIKQQVDDAASSPSQNDVQMLRDQISFLESRLDAAGKDVDAAQKDAARAHRAGKRAFLERQSALKDLETWKADQMKAMKEKITESSMTSQAFQGMQQNQVDSCVQSATRKIGAIQERLLVALVQRDELHNHYHVHHGANNEGGVGPSDNVNNTPGDASGNGARSRSNSVNTVSGPSATAKPMRDAACSGSGGQPDVASMLGGDDWAHMMYEAFFAYERQIYNLKAEVLSLQAIAVMSGNDADSHWRQKVASMQEEMDVLRNAAQEYRAAAGRPHPPSPAPSGGFGYDPLSSSLMSPGPSGASHVAAVPYGGVPTSSGSPGGPYGSSVYTGYPVAN